MIVTNCFIKTIAAAMVEADRNSSDCDDIRFEPDAGNADHWHVRNIASVAQEAGVAFQECGVEACLPEICDAYAVAWREAVEADLAALGHDNSLGSDEVSS